MLHFSEQASQRLEVPNVLADRGLRGVVFRAAAGKQVELLSHARQLTVQGAYFARTEDRVLGVDWVFGELSNQRSDFTIGFL